MAPQGAPQGGHYAHWFYPGFPGRQRATEHFVNLPCDGTGLHGDECPLAEECVVTAIEHDFAVLASPRTTHEEKLAALKFLGHWVGDIHQPPHAASRDDRGGNHIRTQGSSCESLHTLWDSCIVEERLGMHPLTIVSELQAGITEEQRVAWLASDPVDWANELFAIARKPEVGYCVMVDGTCQYAADNREFEEGEPERVVVVDGGYLDMHAPIARARIAMAGIRLAGDQSPERRAARSDPRASFRSAPGTTALGYMVEFRERAQGRPKEKAP